jgi:ABC-type polysaccharide/polyol phosphate export permease
MLFGISRTHWGRWRYWFDFLGAMTEKEFKARYKHAFLGFLWVFLNPLLQMLIIGVVFQFLIKVEVEHYFVFLFTGLLPWNFFSYSLTKTTPSIVYERTLIQKAMFPRESIILSIILSNLIHFLLIIIPFTLIVFLTTALEYGFADWANYLWRFLLLIPTVSWMMALTVGISLITATLNVKFRDTNFIIQALIPFWFYATPIIYTLSLLPLSLAKWAYVNPMTPIIELFHYIVLNKPILFPEMWLIGLLLTLILLVIGIVLFRKDSPCFDDWL